MRIVFDFGRRSQARACDEDQTTAANVNTKATNFNAYDGLTIDTGLEGHERTIQIDWGSHDQVLLIRTASVMSFFNINTTNPVYRQVQTMVSWSNGYDCGF